MVKKSPLLNLSRRERQIMDAVYQLGEATAVDVQKKLPDAPRNATVRKLIRILEEKGYLQHRRIGNRYVYYPTIPAARARESALKNLLDTFFSGSAANAAVAMLNMSESALSDEEREMLVELIEKSRKEGR